MITSFDLLTYFMVAIISLAVTHLLQMNTYVQKFAKANIEFDAMKYLKGERYGIVASIGVVIISLMTINEWVDAYQFLGKFTGVVFAIVGSIGTWGFSLAMGTTKKVLWNAIDKKTNIADGKEIPNDGAMAD